MRISTACPLPVLALALAIPLVGCGGDDSPAPPPVSSTPSPSPAPSPSPSAEGVYDGTATATSAPAKFTLLVQHDGTFWHLYGAKTLAMGAMTGFVQGAGASASSPLTASNALDFGVAPPAAVPFTATATSSGSISGTASYAGASTAFAGEPFDATRYQYGTAAALADVALDWQMTSLQGVSTTVHIAADGTLTATDATGCQMSGGLVPSVDQKNYYAVALTMGPAPCAHAGATMSGIAVRPVTLYGAHLYIAAVSAARDFGVGLSYAP